MTSRNYIHHCWSELRWTWYQMTQGNMPSMWRHYKASWRFLGLAIKELYREIRSYIIARYRR